VTVEGRAEVVGALDELLADVAHPMPAAVQAAYAVERPGPLGTGFVVHEDGDRLAEVASATDARDVVHQRVHRRAFELAARKGWARLHGALVDVDGARVAIVGPAGAGKTTLALALALDGAGIQGDESLLVRDGESLAVPRPLHLKPGIDHQLPALARVLGDLPRVGDVAILDPGRHLALPWALSAAPVDHVVLLEPGDRSVRCEPVGPTAAMPRLVPELFPLVEDKATLLARLSELVRATPVHTLTVGEPASMIGAIHSLAG
jgi:hypothetical protein